MMLGKIFCYVRQNFRMFVVYFAMSGKFFLVCLENFFGDLPPARQQFRGEILMFSLPVRANYTVPPPQTKLGPYAHDTKTSSRKNNKTCFNCGGHTMPSQAQNMHKIVKQNHFAKQCRGSRSTRRSQKPHDSRKELRPIRKSDDERISDSESTEYCYAVNNKQNYQRTSVSINGQRVKMTIDTGSSINVIDKNIFAKLRNIELKQASVKACRPSIRINRSRWKANFAL